ncbi:MAG: hypothetical protein LBB25_02165 [Holosporaceae bacterium]|jgi:hypothetical protein|nr:hypothetical protein [Holosporaceae bacterium]
MVVSFCRLLSLPSGFFLHLKISNTSLVVLDGVMNFHGIMKCIASVCCATVMMVCEVSYGMIAKEAQEIDKLLEVVCPLPSNNETTCLMSFFEGKNIKLSACCETANRVRQTSFSFEYLNSNAQRISSLVSAEYLYGCLDQLFSHIDEIEVPDCPELWLLEREPTLDEINFQKVNRNLFGEVDELIKNGFCKLYKDQELAFPVIEWAANVLPCMQIELIDTFEGENLAAKIKDCVTKNYAQPQLEQYLQDGWRVLQQRVHEIEHTATELRTVQIDQLFDRMRCSMCFPARVSALYTSFD